MEKKRQLALYYNTIFAFNFFESKGIKGENAESFALQYSVSILGCIITDIWRKPLFLIFEQ